MENSWAGGELGGYLVVAVFLGIAALLALIVALVGKASRQVRGTTPTTLSEQVSVAALREGHPNGYYVSFTMPSGAMSEFQIWGEEFERLEVGMRGVLTYRDTNYQSFVPTSPQPEQP